MRTSRKAPLIRTSPALTSKSRISLSEQTITSGTTTSPTPPNTPRAPQASVAQKTSFLSRNHSQNLHAHVHLFPHAVFASRRRRVPRSLKLRDAPVTSAANAAITGTSVVSGAPDSPWPSITTATSAGAAATLNLNPNPNVTGGFVLVHHCCKTLLWHIFLSFLPPCQHQPVQRTITATTMAPLPVLAQHTARPPQHSRLRLGQAEVNFDSGVEKCKGQ